MKKIKHSKTKNVRKTCHQFWIASKNLSQHPMKEYLQSMSDSNSQIFFFFLSVRILKYFIITTRSHIIIWRSWLSIHHHHHDHCRYYDHHDDKMKQTQCQRCATLLYRMPQPSINNIIKSWIFYIISREQKIHFFLIRNLILFHVDYTS